MWYIFAIILLYFEFFPANCFNQTFDEFIASTPTTFGLITVTHARNGVYTYFANHLNTYASMECPEMTQISVVWNNDISPQQANITQNSGWKRPVYFYQTPHNSMDFRYHVPKQSKAQVFFSIDDDVQVTCEELRKSFAVWRKNAIGDIAPFITYGPRSFDFTTKRQTYSYTDPLQAKFFTMSLVGISWIPRFYFDLYCSQKSQEINKMRQIVRVKNNCDDIALNFIVSYFFPQLIPIVVYGQVSMKIFPAAQGLTKTHNPFRNECLKLFSQILGYNPLRYVNRLAQENPYKYKSESMKYAMYLKRKELSQKLIQKQEQLTELSKEQYFQMGEKLQKEINEGKKSISSYVAKDLELKSENENKLKEELQKLQSQLQICRQQYNSNSTKQSSQYSNMQSKLLTNSNLHLTQMSKIEALNNSIDWITNLMIIVGIALALAFLYLLFICCSKRESGQRWEESMAENAGLQNMKAHQEEQNEVN